MIKKFLVVLFVLLVAGELCLRFVFGFCDSVLYREDEHYEYIAQPNQERRRWMNTIQFNAHSMRSEEVDPQAEIVLGFGDSVLNGGQRTDQSDLATTILSDSLSVLLNKKVQFLNISSGSWGPDNCFAYLNEHGNFNASRIYLFVNSHDAYDIMTFASVVGVNKSKPEHQYFSAIVELADRYLIPKLVGGNVDPDRPVEAGGKKFNQGFQAFYDYCREHDIPLTFVLHAERAELVNGEYNESGQQIIDFAESRNIPVIRDLDYGIEEEDYIDYIHVNAGAQRKFANAILANFN